MILLANKTLKMSSHRIRGGTFRRYGVHKTVLRVQDYPRQTRNKTLYTCFFLKMAVLVFQPHSEREEHCDPEN